MLKIRFKLCGRKNLPVYKVVVIDSRKKRDGKVIEEVGYFNPKTGEHVLAYDRIWSCIEQGAQLSKRLKRIIQQEICWV